MADMTGRAERIRTIESELATYHYASAYHVEWLLEQLRTAQAECAALKNELHDCGQKFAEIARLRAVVEAAREADGCFEAALAEGWNDALSNNDVERIIDLWMRRISYAQTVISSAIAALDAAEGKTT